MLDENLELLKPEASNNVVSSSDAVFYHNFLCYHGIISIHTYIHTYIHFIEHP